MTATLTVPLKTHGGKSYLARRIVALMPTHVHYCEPFFGGGAVLLAKDPEGISKVVNDLDESLTGFWRCLRSGGSFERFHRIVQATPFSESEWNEAAEFIDDPDADPVRRAAWYFVQCRQSLAGPTPGRVALTRTNGD